MLDFSLDRWLNIGLLKEPMNWGIVFAIASLWLIAMHVVMQAWAAMIAPGGQGAFGGPGQVAAPVPDVTAMFSTPSLFGLAGGADADIGSGFYGAGMSSWTDGSESKYAEDGWAANG
jgi:hypothetical protein